MVISNEILERGAWELKLSLLPRRCCISGDPIWFSYAYRGRLYIHGLAGEYPIIEEQWVTPIEMIILRLKNKVKHVF
jgi:hypothetical protein